VLSPTSDARIKALMAETGLSREDATAKFLEGKGPTGRFVEAAHIADLMVFLCGPAGQDVTGSVLPVDGGWLAGV
jgi:3-hydroxybutyrate dehydrogenase